MTVNECTGGRRQARVAGRLALALIAVTAGCDREPFSPTPATTDAQPAALATAAQTLTWWQLSSSPDLNHTCGVTTDKRAYCWGNGYLGNGGSSLSTTPVAVAGGLQFRQISAGNQSTCGVTTENKAYCWGDNFYGQLGDGTKTTRETPTPVAGGHLFRHVSAGGETAGTAHACGVDLDGHAFCWGDNDQGRLGDGTTTDRLVPTAVVGGLLFKQISTGTLHTCAVTTTNRAYCWGWNKHGQLGAGSTRIASARPLAVAGGRAFTQISAGSVHTCAVTSGDRAFCWGEGGSGQIGDGTHTDRFTPRAVAGGHSFGRIAAAGGYTCGESTDNRAFCWGYNGYGGLGDGTRTERVVPTAVAGGLFFTQLTTGGATTCGITPNDAAYCWGWNSYGNIGDGTRTDRNLPTRVLDPA